MKFYIENLGTQVLGDVLAELAREGQATEHPQMDCLSRNGTPRVRDLTEVDRHVVERIYRMAKECGFQFNLYKANGENIPREENSILVSLGQDPFKEARKNRAKLPVVFPGSALLRRRALPALH